ncbi:MAG: NADH-quinone oxidoreductase subunit N [Gemmatimonadales bacterium]|nr:MAG: NADH-quinone oxidoreductase subunit N [Gemmatimonadales bacterium]
MELEFTSRVDYIWALLPEIVLSIGAMVVLLVGVFREADDDPAAGDASPLGWISLIALAAAAMANGWLTGIPVASASPMVAVDPFRLFANWIFLGGAGLTILLSFPYVTRQRLQAGEFYTLILLCTVGMMFMASARDLLLLFLGVETMSIAAYVLTAFNRRDRRSSEAGLKYFLLGAFSSAFLLYGIALTWGATGTTNLLEIGEAVAGGAAVPGLIMAGMGLLAIGFAFKVAAVPFHMWTPDVYEGAPTPSTAFMAATVKAASFVAFARLFMEAFPALYDSWSTVFWWLAALTMIIPNVVALSQSNVKRMLAYSSIAHGGYLLVALTAANEMATAGLLFYLLVYSIMNIGALAVVMVASGHAEERLQIGDYAGFGWAQPMLGVVFTIFLLSLAGFPGTGGFMAKIYLLQGAAESELWTLAVVLALATVVSYYYYLRVAWYMWMRPAAPDLTHEEVWVPLPMRMGLVASAAILIFLGIFPGGIIDLARAATHGFFLAGVLP